MNPLTQNATVSPHSPGIVRQRQLSDFLNAELLHTLGAYRLSREKFERLEADLSGPGTERGSREEPLLRACRQGIDCNEVLQLHLHAADKPRQPVSDASREFSPDVPLLTSICNFYDVAIAALKLPEREVSQHADQDHEPDLLEETQVSAGQKLKEVFAAVHDPQRRGQSHEARQLRGRVERMQARRAEVLELLRGAGEDVSGYEGLDSDAEARFTELLADQLQSPDSMHTTVLKAFSEAHTWMHFAEHLRSRHFGEMVATIPETEVKTRRMLRYSLALNTFVFVAARATPWVFAEDEDEVRAVTGEYESRCEEMSPTYCMWIAMEFSMLALHRRAFTHWTLGRHDRAYRDFHKLARLLRSLRDPAESRAVRVPGTRTFIEGMTAMSELHIGRIYRGQHAHRKALSYFRRASGHLRGWEEHGQIGQIIVNSHWRISLLTNQAKAHYELGQVKHSLLCYARAWQAFLRLADSETHATANLEVAEEFIAWLKPIVDEPQLSKLELRRRIAPLIDQFVTLRSPRHLELLAAEILTRTGHLLYVLNLPGAGWEPAASPQRQPESKHDLAFRCIASGARMDPTSTLAAADLLKIKADAKEQEHWPDSPSPVPLADQWPAGSGRFEEAARVIEYTLQRWLADPEAQQEEPGMRAEAQVARRLLASFLIHTDSSNVKLAQVYRYLMQGPRAVRRRTDAGQCTLDFVCMRRYSSFFPFLPRPSAFGAPGGGYFVQVREAGAKAEPFGIAIDPGPDFIENLYRCGFALADLHMIVITHDHADHIASLDALLALMGIRMGLGDDRFNRDGHRLAIVGNESVVRRYRYFDQAPPGSKRVAGGERRDAVTVLGFEEIARITMLGAKQRRADERGKSILPMPASLRIEPVRSWGHSDAHGHVAQGFLLSVGEGELRSSILFTGDTGVPPKKSANGRFAKGRKPLLKAVAEADVVVAHLSAIPLRELREMAGLSGDREPQVVDEFRQLWEKLRERAESKPRNQESEIGIKQAQFLLRQLQFGFRSRPAEGVKDKFAVSPFSALEEIKKQPEQHLYLSGLIEVATAMREASDSRPTPPLLLIGELREELGTFRTRVADRISDAIFREKASAENPLALTADIGLRVRVARTAAEGDIAGDPDAAPISVLCTTCDLDNDLVPAERFHRPNEIREVCVKGEDEGVFYNCLDHDPSHQPDVLWLEAVERFDVFGD